MKQFQWLKFLKETVPDFRTRLQLQEILGHYLIMQAPAQNTNSKIRETKR